MCKSISPFATAVFKADWMAPPKLDGYDLLFELVQNTVDVFRGASPDSIAGLIRDRETQIRKDEIQRASFMDKFPSVWSEKRAEIVLFSEVNVAEADKRIKENRAVIEGLRDYWWDRRSRM